MSGPQWISQEVPPLGAITSEGIMQTLGRPAMSRLTVLVREAAQNSWDAKKPGSDGPVMFDIALRHLRGAELATWRSAVADPAPAEQHLPLRALLAGEDDPLVLFVSDRGTTGLGGPTRADTVGSGDHDYVSFVLNIGEPRDTPLGGGTYGFGKSIFFSTSSAQTIVVYSRCEVDGEPESRLVGCALGSSFNEGGVKFTGRHWWGLRPAGEDAVEPILGGEADELAGQLGFPAFDEREQLGTSVAVICPDLDGRSLDEAGEWLAEAVLWHLWPKLLEIDGAGPELECTVKVDGTPLTVSSPREHAALRLFAAAFETHARGEGEMLVCGRPARRLGRLVLERTLAVPPTLSAVSSEAGVEDGLHHVCLMRPANLVVKYHSGPPTADETVPYAGVFKPLDDLDPVYAKAEPPAHDDWIADQLKGEQKTFVRQTFNRINEALKRFAAPADIAPEGGDSTPLGAASRMFAGLLGPTSSLGASPDGNGPGGGGGRRPVRLVGTPQWERFEGRDVLVQHLEVETSKTVTYRVDLGVSLWGSSGGEGEPPAAADRPRLVGWIDPEDRLHEGEVIAFAAGEKGEWRLAAEPPRDGAVSFRVGEAVREVGER